jgi:hypothetical protein
MTWLPTETPAPLDDHQDDRDHTPEDDGGGVVLAFRQKRPRRRR